MINNEVILRVIDNISKVNLETKTLKNRKNPTVV